MNSNKSYRLVCYTCLLVAFSFFFTTMFAQNANNPTDRSTDQGNYILEQEMNYTPQATNSANIIQAGVENKAEINQIREINQLGLNAVVNQNGYYNEIIVSQQGGNQNFTAIQNGQDNYIISESNGSKQQVYLEQNGQSNKIYQELNGTNEGVFIITQDGADHEVYHTRQGNAPILEIRQTGFGAKVTIEQQ